MQRASQFFSILFLALLLGDCGNTQKEGTNSTAAHPTPTPTINPDIQWAEKEAKKLADRYVTHFNGLYYAKTKDVQKSHQEIFNNGGGGWPFLTVKVPSPYPYSGFQFLETDLSKIGFNEVPLSTIDKANGYVWKATGYFSLYGRFRWYYSADRSGCDSFTLPNDNRRCREYPSEEGWSCYSLMPPENVERDSFFWFSVTKLDNGEFIFLSTCFPEKGSPDKCIASIQKPTEEEIRRIIKAPKKQGCPLQPNAN